MDVDDARTTWKALNRAVRDTPPSARATRGILRRHRNEYHAAVRAAEIAEENEEPVSIEPVGTIVPGMLVGTNRGSCEVIRFTNGFASMLVASVLDGHQDWLNFTSAASPVAVIDVDVRAALVDAEQDEGES